MLYQDGIEQIYCSFSCTYKLQYVYFYNFWYFCEVTIVAEQRQASLVTTFLFFYKLVLPSTVLLPLLPYLCSDVLVLQRQMQC